MFLEKAAAAFPDAPIAMLYTWKALVDKKEEAIWGPSVSVDFMFPQHEKVLPLFASYHDVAWASNELFRERATKLPDTAVANEHFDAFGHRLNGNLICYLVLRCMKVATHQSSNGPAKKPMMSTALSERTAAAEYELGAFVKKALTHRCQQRS